MLHYSCTIQGKATRDLVVSLAHEKKYPALAKRRYEITWMMAASGCGIPTATRAYPRAMLQRKPVMNINISVSVSRFDEIVWSDALFLECGDSGLQSFDLLLCVQTLTCCLGPLLWRAQL